MMNKQQIEAKIADAPANTGADRRAVNPLVVMREQAERYASNDRAMGLDPTQATTTAREALRAVEALVMKADAIVATLELPGYAKQSNKNANAGFIDWRDWCALLGEVNALRAALAPFGDVR